MEDRTKYIGGSDVAAICGISPCKTPLQLYLEKIGEGEPQKDNPAMVYGRMMEGAIRDWYVHMTRRKVSVPPMLYHKKYGFLCAHLDGICEDAEPILEIKTARSSDDWGDPGTDEIPVYYMTQAQHNMMVAGRPVCDVPVAFFGQEPVIYTVEADVEIQEMLIEKSVRFWEMVRKREAPEPVCLTDVNLLFGKKSISDKVTAPVEVQEALEQLKALKAEVEQLEAEHSALRMKICSFMGEKDTLIGIDGKVLATWKKAKDSFAFDMDRFKEENPALFGQYQKPKTGSRRFLIK